MLGIFMTDSCRWRQDVPSALLEGTATDGCMLSAGLSPPQGQPCRVWRVPYRCCGGATTCRVGSGQRTSAGMMACAGRPKRPLPVGSCVRANRSGAAISCSWRCSLLAAYGTTLTRTWLCRGVSIIDTACRCGVPVPRGGRHCGGGPRGLTGEAGAAAAPRARLFSERGLRGGAKAGGGAFLHLSLIHI